jgi:hypothetical protein
MGYHYAGWAAGVARGDTTTGKAGSFIFAQNPFNLRHLSFKHS